MYADTVTHNGERFSAYLEAGLARDELTAAVSVTVLPSGKVAMRMADGREVLLVPRRTAEHDGRRKIAALLAGIRERQEKMEAEWRAYDARYGKEGSQPSRYRVGSRVGSRASKFRRAPRPSAWSHRAARAFSTNHPSPAGTSPVSVCSSGASGTIGGS